MEVLELAEEALRTIAETKTADIQLTDNLPESIEENELKDTLSQLNAAGRGTRSRRVRDWVHHGSVEICKQNQLSNVADAYPSARVSVHPTPKGTSMPVNPEGVNISIANFDDLHCYPSMPVATSRLNDIAFAPPPFDIAYVNPRTFVKICVSNPL